MITIFLSFFALSAALGLTLYAGLAAPGMAAYFGLVALPASLAGLATPAVWGSLLGLLALEWLASSTRLTDLAWTLLHTLVRPLAASLLASVGLDSLPRSVQWGGALAAFVIALLVQLTVLALRVAARTPAPSPHPWIITALQTFLAAALGILAFVYPEAAAVIAGLLILIPLPWAPRLGVLAYSALRAGFAALAQPGRTRTRWETGADRLPSSVRQAIEAHLGRRLGAVRSARITLARLGPHWLFQRGRLVIIPQAPPLFARRRLFRPHVRQLDPGVGRANGELLLELLEIEAATPYALCVGPEAPPSAVILAAIEGKERYERKETPGADEG